MSVILSLLLDRDHAVTYLSTYVILNFGLAVPPVAEDVLLRTAAPGGYCF